LEKTIEELTSNEHFQRELRFYCQEHKCNSIYQVKDKLRDLIESEAKPT
jgi:hypothetical protein